MRYEINTLTCRYCVYLQDEWIYLRRFCLLTKTNTFRLYLHLYGMYICVHIEIMCQQKPNADNYLIIFLVIDDRSLPSHLRLEVHNRHTAWLNYLLHSRNWSSKIIAFGLPVFQKSLMQYIVFKFFSTDKVVGVAVDLPWTNWTSRICRGRERNDVPTNMWNYTFHWSLF